jgi:hypothetical protein
MTDVMPCLCGAMPLVEKGVGKFVSGDGEAPTERYRCPNCANKELPFLDARGSSPDSLREWNRIAPKRSYHKRTLRYNIHGVCVDEPYKVFEWRERKYWHVTVTFYLDNGMYYYCFDYDYRNGGIGSGLWIGDPCFPSMAAAKRHAVKMLAKGDKRVAAIAKRLLFEPVQGELF